MKRSGVSVEVPITHLPLFRGRGRDEERKKIIKKIVTFVTSVSFISFVTLFLFSIDDVSLRNLDVERKETGYFMCYF